ncbi:phosphate ABC transporter substrate-binding protein [Duganella sp. PWIR1]
MPKLILTLLSRLLLACLLLAGAGAQASPADFVVVVSARSPLTALSAEQVAAIFMSQTGRFPGGEEAIPLDLPFGSPLRDAFYNKVAARTPALMKAYWTKMVFTGRAQPPRELSNSVAARRMVADNPAMIAYIDRAALDASVKAIQVTP